MIQNDSRMRKWVCGKRVQKVQDVDFLWLYLDVVRTGHCSFVVINRPPCFLFAGTAIVVVCYKVTGVI